jgi:hypothetical protein
MRLVTCWALAGLFCVSAAASAAPNAKLAEARRLVDDLDFEAALKALDAAERADDNELTALTEILLLQGIAFGTLGKDAKTRDAFRKLLVLAPETKLPNDLPPRVRTPFFEAKDWASTNGPLTATQGAEVADGVVKQINVTVGKDPLRLARAVRFHVSGSGPDLVVDVALTGGRAETAVMGRARITWFAELLNERKGVLLKTSARDDGKPAEVAAKSTVVEAPAQPVAGVSERPVEGGWRRPAGFVLIGGAALTVGIGAVMGVQSSAARAKVTGATKDASGRVVSLSQKDAAALESAANAQATVANVLFGAGAGLAAAGVVLVVLGPSSAPTLALQPTPGGVVFTGSF